MENTSIYDVGNVMSMTAPVFCNNSKMLSNRETMSQETFPREVSRKGILETQQWPVAP